MDARTEGPHDVDCRWSSGVPGCLVVALVEGVEGVRFRHRLQPHRAQKFGGAVEIDGRRESEL